MCNDIVTEERQADGEVMRSLMGAYPAPMTEEEIRRDLREPEEPRVTDALNRLDGAGLIHRFGDFILPTRTAFHAGQIEYFSPEPCTCET